MYEGVLRKMQECVQKGTLIIPVHAAAALKQDLLFREDVEHCIMIGEIVERQWDRVYNEHKYVIAGEAESGGEIAVVAKLQQINGTIVITVFRVY